MGTVAACKCCLRCLSQHRELQHLPCNESAQDLGPRAVGLALQSSSYSRNQQQLHLIWLHCCRASQLGWKRCSKSVKPCKDLFLSLLLWVTLWNKIFLFLEPRKDKGKFSHLFKGMVMFIEISDAATGCPCFLMCTPEWGMRQGAAART